MEYEEFMREVKRRAELEDDLQAERAVEATLSTMAERLRAREADQLAKQLPNELKPYLRQQETHKNLAMEEFYNVVSQRESIGFPMARQHARAVMSVVRDRVPLDEIRGMLAQLPDEYVDLFNFGSDGSEWRRMEP
ncbi:MAG TPA: DUF2267 domain-containing protein [Anaerolineaceae bacterium]|nr:DUF2267 domain-containing protein [Anaerolineaceae bacterium]